MYKRDEYTMKEAIEALLKKYKLSQKFTEHDIFNTWVKCMGVNVGTQTTKVNYYDGAVVVYLKKAVMRDAFSKEKEKIIDMLNEELKEKLIKKIDFK